MERRYDPAEGEPASEVFTFEPRLRNVLATYRREGAQPWMTRRYLEGLRWRYLSGGHYGWQTYQLGVILREVA